MSPLIHGSPPGSDANSRIAQLEKNVKQLSDLVARSGVVTNATQGWPPDATLSIPHNDSWIFEDNVDATHAANLRYIVSKNVTRVVSARLSIHLAPYRTYNNFSATTTLADSNDHVHAGATHVHGSAAHNHTWHAANVNPTTPTLAIVSGAVQGLDNANLPADIPTTTVTPGNTGNPTAGNTGIESATHTHLISVTSTLGVTEGATATGVTIGFDGVDATAALGGPFNADVIELDVRRFLIVTTGVFHTIAMQPSGNGRIEAHLRLGVYVSAGQNL